MKLAEGVNLHFIKKPGYKMNHITFRFSGAHLEKTVTRRVLVAQMLTTAIQNRCNKTHARTQIGRASCRERV